ncbi:hypothetical protein TIFTF001_005588 [Ficus carica]|uniref:peptidylprolyl isomerase n=1 Tax=Ficus carica TaxID=3494 RepID=A0AA87ZP60_FICCA|nr:hypothetical protein TIFTF001_005588 [Ficus carica]
MRAAKATDMSEIRDDDDLDEEPGEEVESAPPLRVGEERDLGSSGIKKKLLRRGRGWETPELGDEATVHYVGSLLDGTTFESTRDRDEPLTIKLGQGQVTSGVDDGIITMIKGEIALFTLPAEKGYGVDGRGGVVPPNSVVRFEVELVSWISVVDVSKDGGIIKKVMEKGHGNGGGFLDEVLVKYRVELVDGTTVAESPKEGIEFYVKDGHLCPAFPKAIVTLERGEKARLIVQPQYAFGEQGRGASEGFPSIPGNSVLYIDVELVSFKHVIDVTGDAKVFKKILKEGEDAHGAANEGATVTISYTARLEDGTVFEKKGIDGETPLKFVTDEEHVITGLDIAAATMKKGEHAILTIHPDYGFGNIEVRRDLAVVPPSSTLTYEVEMLDCIKAADCVSEEVSFGDDELKLAKPLRVSCWLNGAACSLKLNDYQGAIELCSKVLDVEFQNVKALYRRAQAYMGTADLVLADLDIKKALEADPDNREVKLIQRNLKQLQVESNKRDAKLYANMFARTIKITPNATKKLKVGKTENDRKDEDVVAMDVENVAHTSDPDS